MANGAPISEEHDRVLRGVLGSTGKPLAHWYKKLDEAGVQRRSYLAALNLLRDDLGVPHQAASAIAWSFFNPSMVPDEMVGAARAASDVVEKFTEDPLARRAVAKGDDDEAAASPAPRPGSGKKGAATAAHAATPKAKPKAAPRRSTKPAPKAAPKPAKKAAARTARKPSRKPARKR